MVLRKNQWCNNLLPWRCFLTQLASCTKFSCILEHVWPIKFLKYSLSSLLPPKMSSRNYMCQFVTQLSCIILEVHYTAVQLLPCQNLVILGGVHLRYIIPSRWTNTLLYCLLLSQLNALPLMNCDLLVTAPALLLSSPMGVAVVVCTK